MTLFEGDLSSATPMLLGLVYLILKVIVRHIIRSIADVESDTLDTFAWFGVDLSILALSLAVASDTIFGGTQMDTKVGMLYFFGFALFGILAYGLFTRIRKSTGNHDWARYLKIYFCVSSSWLSGLFSFSIVASKFILKP
jgi:hypothetical protein